MATENKCKTCKKAERTEYTELNGIYYCHYYGGYTDGIMFDPLNCPEYKDEKTMKEKALKKLYDRLGFINPDPKHDEEHDYLTENTARNGRNVLWYMDESNCEAIYTDTLEFLTKEEIEEQFC